MNSTLATPWKPAASPLLTIFASDVSPTSRTSFPRPQLVRPYKEWKSLNGLWNFDFTVPNLDQPPFGRALNYTILVPFPVESPLSGLRNSTHDGYMWYRREFDDDNNDWLDCHNDDRTLLHVEASDWNTTVYVNGFLVGDPHTGGYDPFYYDITQYLFQRRGNNEKNENIEIVVGVHDPTEQGGYNNAIGKQDSSRMQNPWGITYTSTSGMWGTIWLECVPSQAYFQDLRIDTSSPILKGVQVQVDVTHSDSASPNDKYFLQATLYSSNDDGAETVATAKSSTMGTLTLMPPSDRPFKLWSPDRPYLYNLQVDLLVQQSNNDTLVVLDTVISYVGVRTISLGHPTTNSSKTPPTLLLNGQPIFQIATLDQGFNPDGNYAFATDEAMEFDVMAHKQLGFNTVRKHVKMELQRWYYHADRLGLLVWQDLPSRTMKDMPNTIPPGGAWQSWWEESSRAIRSRVNHPSIVQWIAYNEGWGQEYPANTIITNTTVKRIQTMDPTRLVTDASGGRNVCTNATDAKTVSFWAGGCVGHVVDAHCYSSPHRLTDALKEIYDKDLPKNKVFVLGEYGGVLLRPRGHEWFPSRSHGVSEVTTRRELENRYQDFATVIMTAIDNVGLSGVVYTQFTDVETECNGLLTYDRILKVDPEVVAATNKMVLDHFHQWTARQEYNTERIYM